MTVYRVETTRYSAQGTVLGTTTTGKLVIRIADPGEQKVLVTSVYEIVRSRKKNLSVEKILCNSLTAREAAESAREYATKKNMARELIAEKSRAIRATLDNAVRCLSYGLQS